MISAPTLEIDVLVLGLFILMAEAFSEKIDKRTLAFTAIIGLATILVASFFVAPTPTQVGATGFWNFYTADPLAIFFKRFALVTTILVLVMMIDYAPVVSESVHGVTQQAGLGEFFALPIFTCVGLMWMASAIDAASVDAVTRPVNVEAFIVCSACRIRQSSKISAHTGGAMDSVSMYKKFSLNSRSSRGGIGSSP